MCANDVFLAVRLVTDGDVIEGAYTHVFGILNGRVRRWKSIRCCGRIGGRWQGGEALAVGV